MRKFDVLLSLLIILLTACSFTVSTDFTDFHTSTKPLEEKLEQANEEVNNPDESSNSEAEPKQSSSSTVKREEESAEESPKTTTDKSETIVDGESQLKVEVTTEDEW